MKQKSIFKWLSAGIACLSITSTQVAGSTYITEQEWSFHQDTHDEGSLTVDGDVLRISFNTTVSQEYQFGNELIHQSAYSIYLKTPVKLSSEQTRVFFTAKGILQPYNRTSDSYNLFPVIRDASGEEFLYTPYPETYLGQSALWHVPAENWQRWRSNYFYVNEAGGSATDIYEALGGDGNSWPDGDLTFVGFKLLVRAKEMKPLSGDIIISDISIGAKNVPEYTPYIFAGNSLKEKGDYIFAYTIRNEFQALPVAERTMSFSFDPDDPASSSRKLEVPLGPADNYWVRYSLTNLSGRLIDTDTARWQVEQDLGGNLDKIDITSPPSVGFMRINPIVHTQGIYEQSDPFEVTVRLFAKKHPGTFRLSWELLDYNQGMDAKSYNTVYDSSSQDLVIKQDGWADITLTLTKQAERDAYRLKLRMEQDGEMLDEEVYVLGFKTDFSSPLTNRVGHKFTREEVKKSTYYQTTFHHPSYAQPKSLEEDLDGFSTYLRESRQLSQKTNILLDVRDMEVLPGVYNFYILDRYLDLVADYGMSATISFRHYDSRGTYLWQKYTRQRSFDQVEINQHNYGSFDFSDTRISDAWKRAAHKVWMRYKKHPAFLGYYFYSVAGELSIIDKPWHGINVGHNVVSAQAFRDYLRDELGLSLETLNQRWQSDYSAWSEVAVPQPTYEKGAMPDLRMSWIDFSTFKKYQDIRYWYEMIVQDVRTYDNEHIIVCHNGCHVPVRNYGLQDYSHNGGNHRKQFEKSMQAAWEQGTGQITEPHNPHHWATYGDPEERGWVLDHSVYCMLAQGGGGCANLGTYWLNNPERLIDHYGGSFAYDRVEKFKPILNELVQTRLIMEAPMVGLLQDPYTLYTKHRTTFAPRLQDLQRWFELVKDDGLGYGDLVLPNDEWSPDLDTFKLLVPNLLDEVMSKKNISKLDERVRSGAKMVLSANTGRYCPEDSGQDFVLLRQLGIQAPEGAFDLSGKNIRATIDTENPIFPMGRQFPFYTTEQQREESQSDLVKNMASFWKWPYRWLPISNYFGYFSKNMTTNGRIIARFPNGAVALSTHQVGKGEVLVLWGTPDYKPELYKGFMTDVARWAGAVQIEGANPMASMFELAPMDGRLRHYAVIYEEDAGTYRQKIPNLPDGTYFVDDMITDHRFGTFTADELRQDGLEITIDDETSPLRIVRCINTKEQITNIPWRAKYRMPIEGATP